MRNLADISMFEELQNQAHCDMGLVSSVSIANLGGHLRGYSEVALFDAIKARLNSKTGPRWRLTDAELVDCVSDVIYDQTLAHFGWKDSPRRANPNFDFNPVIDEVRKWVEWASECAYGSIQLRNLPAPNSGKKGQFTTKPFGRSRATWKQTLRRLESLEKETTDTVMSLITGGQA